VTLDELARARPFAQPLAVPEWTLGCFHRRSITFANGQEDRDTQVIWLQSHGLTGDIRVSKNRPALNGRQSLTDCSAAELAVIGQGDGFVARTAFADGHMRWDAFAAFQPYDKWPEPGRLERVGPALIEWAPSGVYVEDWRLQPKSSGLSVGLRLISETRLDGVEHPREGGMVIAGDHALMVIGRREPLPQGRVQELIARSPRPREIAKAAFDCEVAYALASEGGYEIVLAIDPFANGRALFLDNGFEAGEAPDELIQRPGPTEGFSLRRWKIDTLLAGQKRSRETPATAQSLSWLEAEKDTLLR
jgi:hypothetical protein